MGGAIALGHPLGATGAIRAATVVHALQPPQPEVRHGHDVRRHGPGRGRHLRAGLSAPQAAQAIRSVRQTAPMTASQLALRDLRAASAPQRASVRDRRRDGRAARTTTPPFAHWLRGQGYAASGPSTTAASGDSLPAGRSRCAASRPTCSTGRATIDAAIDALPGRALPIAPLYLLGHSLGAQLPGLLQPPRPHRRPGQHRRGQRLLARQRAAAQAHRAVLLVRAGAAGDARSAATFRAASAWQGGRPAARRDAAVAALVPAPALPASAPRARRLRAQLRRRVRFPVVALSITDDELMTERGTRVPDRLLRERAARSVQRIAPADVGAQAHRPLRFLPRQFEPTLWRRLEQLLAGFGPRAGAAS